MKRIFSILTVILILTAMLHISVANHYCGGDIAASKISLSGELATCGMEGTEDSCPLKLPGESLKSHCCDDVVSVYSFDNTYTPVNSLVPETFRFTTQILAFPVCVAVQKPDLLPLFYTNVSPPGALMSTNVDLSNICVFRI
ncbi:MAG: hypothetical protein IPH69_00030 [Bacteroidales bacterium]|nr:hypothetical protein [Bacteroidales bacterium]